MAAQSESRSERVERQIIEAATAAFIRKGYDGTNMEEIATNAAVSKQTVYKHFSDKETLFCEVVTASAARANDIVEPITRLLTKEQFEAGGLKKLGRFLMEMFTNQELLRLRRLIIANADRMPQLGRSWYRNGFERMIGSMGGCFRELTKQGLLKTPDPDLAASHFFGLLLWIPMNEAMFTGGVQRTAEDLERHADESITAFLSIYSAAAKA